MGGGQMLEINGSRRNNNGATHLHAQRTTQQLTQKILNERGLTHKEGSQRVCVCVEGVGSSPSWGWGSWLGILARVGWRQITANEGAGTSRRDCMSMVNPTLKFFSSKLGEKMLLCTAVKKNFCFSFKLERFSKGDTHLFHQPSTWIVELILPTD